MKWIEVQQGMESNYRVGGMIGLECVFELDMEVEYWFSIVNNVSVE